MKIFLKVMACLVLAGLISCSGKKKSTLIKPNVLFIAVDDLNDWTGLMGGNKQVISPNLDKLAEEGVLFTNAHTPMAVCIASRNALLSGLHPTTTGWYSINQDMAAMNTSYPTVMAGKKMLPHYFKSNGYNTYCAGKIFHTGSCDYPFLMDSLWSDVLPKYKDRLTKKDLARGGGYGGYKFYPFPKDGSQLKNHYGDALGGGHSLCGGPLDKEDIPGGKMYDELIAEYAIQKLEEDHDSPFFLSVGFVRPHVPYTAPRKYFDMYEKEMIAVPDVPTDEMKDIPMMGKAIAFNYGETTMGDYQAVKGMGEEYWRHLVHSYLACVSFVDDQLGRVLQALENSKYADNTIIVLWSDHGQSLGEKRNFRKMSLWEESTRVPLCILLPNNVQGRVCSKPVGLMDIYPTLVELCGLPELKHLNGNSLVPLLNNPDASWTYPVVTSWRYKNYAVRTSNYRYVLYRDGSEELYDHVNDPGEHLNLASNGDYRKIMDGLKKWIPENPVLPVGMNSWEGDEIDHKIVEWNKTDSIPYWLN